MIQIAIEGLSGSGRSVVAKRLAKRLNINFYDTDLIRLAIAVACIKKSVNPTNESDLQEMLKTTDIILQTEVDGSTKVVLNTENITLNLKNKLVIDADYLLSKSKVIENFICEYEKRVAQNQSIVVEGVNAATRILPEAKYKFFLTAEARTRAERKFKALRERGKTDVSFDKVFSETVENESIGFLGEEARIDSNTDVITIDTTNESIENVVNRIYNIVKVDLK